MIRLTQNLTLPRCPHCAVAHPNLFKMDSVETHDHLKTKQRLWVFYACGGCGGVVTACAAAWGAEVLQYLPTAPLAKEDIPERPRSLLQQAMESLHAPSGAVMLAGSAIDAMLKLKGYTEGSLYTRIDQAAADHLITAEMARWAHEVRLDANNQRHADESADLPSAEDAKRVIDFASAFAEFLFVLPAKVQRGIESA